MIYQNPRHANFLGIILIILGIVILGISLGDFIIRFALAFFGLYLIYNGLRMRNQLQKVFFFFNQFGNQSSRFW